MQGLRQTRWYKKHTRFLRFVPNHVEKLAKLIWSKLNAGKSMRNRRSLVWTAGVKKRMSLNAFHEALQQLP